MDYEFSEGGRQLTGEDLDRLEDETDLSFPKDLREFYISHNGGRITPNCVLVNGDYYCVDSFLVINSTNSSSDFRKTYDLLTAWNQVIPEDCIPVATLPWGDFFVYRTERDFSGQIWCYQHEFPGDPSQAMVRISDSLASFLGSMTAQP